MYCKECGKFLIYDNAIIHYGKNLTTTGLSFISKRIYNGQTFSLCRCKECVGKKFPEIYTKKNIFACKFSKVVQYAFDIPNNIFNEYVHKRQALTKDRMIKLYGEEIGLEKWNAYRQKQSITNTFKYKQEKYGMTKEEFDEYNKSRSSTKELFIKRHGIEEGTKMWNEYCERQRYTTSLEYFIEKYGEIKGIEKYNTFCDARIEAGKQSSELHNTTSKIADELFIKLISYFPNNKIWTHITNLGEKIINHKYAIDYYDETNNIAIEFYGDYWHMNPQKYNENTIIPFITKCKYFHTAKDLWNYDKKRINKISKKLKTDVIIIWENEYRKNKQQCIENILSIINNKQ